MKRVLTSLADLLFPPHCHGCNEPLTERDQDFCAACQGLLTACMDPYCQRCGSPAGEADRRPDGCTECRHRLFPWERVIRHGIYEGGLRNLILRLKNRREDSLARAVGREWGRQSQSLWEALGPVRFFPMPRFWFKNLLRGHNPPEGLVRGLTSQVSGLVDCRSLYRKRPTLKQSDLPRSRRRANVRGSFAWRGPSQAATDRFVAVLVDDIMTTGATAIYAAKTLKEAGFKRIVVAVLARVKS